MKNKKFYHHDFSRTLPTKLHRRVEKILKDSPSFLIEPRLNQCESQSDDIKEHLLIHQMNKTQNLPKTISINEEICNDPNILEAEKNFKQFELKLEQPLHKTRTDLSVDSAWSSEFLKKKVHERVKWQSKYHRLEKRLSEKPIFVQADELIDVAAADFSDWINSLSSDSRLNITKDLIKELFPIELEGDDIKALHVEPIQIKAIADDVGNAWNLPHVG